MPGYINFNLPPEYRAMTQLDASGFAWEWLRRNPAFRSLWDDAGAAVRRAADRAAIAARRTISTVTEFDQHPLAERMAPWGLTFRAVA